MRPARATLVRQRSADGLVEAWAPVGQRYDVDLDSIREARLWNVEWKQMHTKALIDVIDETGGRHWFALELLELDRRALS